LQTASRSMAPVARWFSVPAMPVPAAPNGLGIVENDGLAEDPINAKPRLDEEMAAKLGQPTFDLAAEINSKHPGKNARWAGANTYRTLEWLLPHPPPFHCFEEVPLVKETVGSAAIHPRPMAFDPVHDDPDEHSYHPGVSQSSGGTIA